MSVRLAVLLIAVLLLPDAATAKPHDHQSTTRDGTSGTDHPPATADRPSGVTFEKLLRVISMRDYNTRVVLFGTLLLGACAGAVGTLMLLRKRSLVGDVVSHSALPGIAVAFIVMEIMQPGSGKTLTGLLAGALVAGASAVLSMICIGRYTRIKEDAAMAIVLGIFYGLGVALFTVVQNMPTGNTAGLQHFILGAASTMTADNVKLIGVASLVVLVVCVVLFKEFSLLCFDDEFAASQGWPVFALDLALTGLVVGVTVIGLQSVGLLMVALLIIPSAAARFWTDDLRKMTLTAVLLGGLSAFLGVVASALVPRLSGGPVIVLVGTVFFLLSLFLGTRRGIVRQVLLRMRTKRRVGRLDLLRAFYEALEPATAGDETIKLTGCPVAFEQLVQRRSWRPQRVERLLSTAIRQKLVRHRANDATYCLTDSGAAESRRIVRNHRLWETYLITYADVAPSHVDRDADQIEHVLEPELVEELDALLAERYPQMTVPPSPHGMEP